MLHELAADSIHFYSGSSYAQRPIYFTVEDKEFAVDRVLAEWRSPGGKFFLVRTQDGQIYTIMQSPDE